MSRTFFLLSVITLQFSIVRCGNLEIELVNELFENYNKNTRPVHNASEAVKVTIGLTLHELIEVNMEKNSITAVFWFNYDWTDPFLSWKNKRKYAEVGDIRLNPSDIWTPDVEVYNLREGKFLASERNNRVVLYSSGKIVWVPPYHITAACSLDSTWFPFDDQKCEFKIGSWTYNGFMLDIKEAQATVDTSSYVRNPDWDLVGTNLTRHTVQYECCPEPYISLTASLHLRRRGEMFWLKFILPSYLFTFLCLLAGLIPPSVPLARLAVIILMILLVLLTVPPRLPPLSLLANMISHNFLLEILLLVQTILIISLNHFCLKYSKALSIIKIADFVILAGLFCTFIILACLNILSAPIHVV